MGKSLMEQCGVEEDGPWVVKLFFREEQVTVPREEALANTDGVSRTAKTGVVSTGSGTCFPAAL